MRETGKEHTSIKNMSATDATKTIIDRYIFTVGKVYGKKVLDFGCGSGHGTMLMRTYGAEYVWGYDKNPKAIEEAIENYSGIPGIDFRNTLEYFGKESFDIIVSFEVFEHIPMEELNKLVIRLKSYLKKDGIFILSTPINRGMTSDPYHNNEMTQETFTKFMDNNFEEWELYSTIERQDGLWINTTITNGVTPISRCFLVIARK